MKVQIENALGKTFEMELVDVLTPDYLGQGELFEHMARTIGRMSAALVECGALELDAAVVACGVEHRKVKRVPAKPIGAVAKPYEKPYEKPDHWQTQTVFSCSNCGGIDCNGECGGDSDMGSSS